MHNKPHSFQGGVRGQINSLVGNFLDLNAYGEVKSMVWFYEFEVKEILQDWPERDFRLRKWVIDNNSNDQLVDGT